MENSWITRQPTEAAVHIGRTPHWQRYTYVYTEYFPSCSQTMKFTQQQHKLIGLAFHSSALGSDCGHSLD